MQQPVKQYVPGAQPGRHETPQACLPAGQIGVGQLPPDPAAPSGVELVPAEPPEPPVPLPASGVQSAGSSVLPKQSSQRPQSLTQFVR